MRAAYIENLGPPEAIRYGELPAPRPGPTDVLVEVAATTVNPVDTLVRAGLYQTSVCFPFIIGRDLVGTVVEAGPGAAGFRPGDPVWCNSLGHGGRQGAAAELAVVSVDRLYPLPAGVSALDAVAVVHPAATAYLALVAHGRLRPTDTVLVAGAAGNVGRALTEIATRAGARVVATADGRDLESCRALGAAVAVDYHDPDAHRKVRVACPDGIDVIVDTSGTNDLDAAVDLLADRGRIVLVAGARTRPPLPVGNLYVKDGTVAGFVISRATTAELAEASSAINRLLSRGGLRPGAVEALSLRLAADAHRRMEAGQLRGKRVLLLPDGKAGA